MKYSFAVLALWAIAVAATVFIVKDSAAFTFLGPVYAVCAIGSVVVVRRAQQASGGAAA